MICTKDEKYYLVCDFCLNPANQKFDSYDEVIDYKKLNNWIWIKDPNEWFDVCPECQIK